MGNEKQFHALNLQTGECDDLCDHLSVFWLLIGSLYQIFSLLFLAEFVNNDVL